MDGDDILFVVDGDEGDLGEVFAEAHDGFADERRVGCDEDLGDADAVFAPVVALEHVRDVWG